MPDMRSPAVNCALVEPTASRRAGDTGRVAVLLSLLVTSGCILALFERDYGISRSAVLKKVPDIGCVRRVLAGMKEITKTQVMSDHGGISESGAPQEELHVFDYEGTEFWASLSIRAFRDDPIDFRQERITVNRNPPAKELRETRRVMILIEQRLASECDVPELKDSVKEWARG
jgi:hypothetical protein